MGFNKGIQSNNSAPASILCSSRATHCILQISKETTSASQSGRSTDRGRCRPSPQYMLRMRNYLSQLMFRAYGFGIQQAVNSRLGRTENAHFLEQFRYTIIASQLLNASPNATSYNRSDIQFPADEGLLNSPSDDPPIITWLGLCFTATAAFGLAQIVHWARSVARTQTSWWFTVAVLLVCLVAVAASYAYLRRQWLKNIRLQAVDSVSLLVTNAQSFDAAALAAISLIQEVELVSRGYRMYVTLFGNFQTH